MMDQEKLWNRKHAAQEHRAWFDKPNTFARSVTKDFLPGSRLLELGCGIGADARYFAKLKMQVIATDFSDRIIEQNKNFQLSNLQFKTMDIAQSFPFSDGYFDIVYAHLSLHYFTDAITRQVFDEIARVLKPAGKLYFSCRSISDPLYGEGEMVERDVFTRDQHIRHFYSTNYTKAVLAEHFTIRKLTSVSGAYTNHPAAFIRCWAEKKR